MMSWAASPSPISSPVRSLTKTVFRAGELLHSRRVGNQPASQATQTRAWLPYDCFAVDDEQAHPRVVATEPKSDTTSAIRGGSYCSLMIAAFGTWGVWPALTAVGTVGAVIVALYLGPLRDRRRRPELQLQPGVVQVFNRDSRAPGSHPVAVATIRVSNRKHRDAATAVQVFVQSVAVGADGVPLAIRPLMWTQSRSAELDVGPGSVFDLDFLRVTRMGEEGEKRAAIAFADRDANAAFYLPAQAELDQLPRGEYRFTLSVRGRNLDARIWAVPATFDGCGGDGVDGIHDHLIIGIPEPVD